MTQHKYGCGIACISILTGIEYDTLLSFLVEGHDLNKEGITNIKEVEIMKQLGYQSKISKTYPPEWSKAILTVESLNEKYKWHAIAWIDGKILDPNLGIKGRKVYTMEIIEDMIKNQTFSLAEIQNYELID